MGGGRIKVPTRERGAHLGMRKGLNTYVDRQQCKLNCKHCFMSYKWVFLVYWICLENNCTWVLQGRLLVVNSKEFLSFHSNKFTKDQLLTLQREMNFQFSPKTNIWWLIHFCCTKKNSIDSKHFYIAFSQFLSWEEKKCACSFFPHYETSSKYLYVVFL